jgi:large subunit ribosomal protein L29
VRTKQLRGMKSEELNKKLSELKLELMKETGNVKMGKTSKNTGKIKDLKRNIARILTIQQQPREERIKNA